MAPNETELEKISPNPNQSGLIDLRWNAVTGATSYNIYRKEGKKITNLTGLSPIASPTGNTFRDTVDVDETYYYVIEVVDSTGKSPISNNSSVTVKKFSPMERIARSLPGETLAAIAFAEGYIGNNAAIGASWLPIYGWSIIAIAILLTFIAKYEGTGIGAVVKEINTFKIVTTIVSCVQAFLYSIAIFASLLFPKDVVLFIGFICPLGGLVITLVSAKYPKSE